VNVGNEIPQRVIMTGPGTIRHVGRETLGRRQAGAFTDQEDNNGWVEQISQIIEHAYAAMTDKKSLTEPPAARDGFLLQQWEQTRRLRHHGGGRETVTDRDLKVRCGRTAV
jgi:hypothetical protein